MTARTRRGYKPHATTGADEGSSHHRLNKRHSTGFRPGGMPHDKEASISGPPTPAVLGASQGSGMIPPEMSAAGGTGSPMGAAPDMDEEDG